MTFRAAPATDLAAIAKGGRPLHAPQPSDEQGGDTLAAFRDPRGRTTRLVQGDDPASPILIGPSAWPT